MAMACTNLEWLHGLAMEGQAAGLEQPVLVGLQQAVVLALLAALAALAGPVAVGQLTVAPPEPLQQEPWWSLQDLLEVVAGCHQEELLSSP